MNNKKETILFYTIFTSFVLFNIWLIFKSRLLPMNDLHQHLAFATIARYIGETDNYFDNFYRIYPFFMKWNTLHPFFCSLKFWPSVEFANRIFLSMYIILFPTSIWYFIKKINGNIWFSLLSFSFLYNFNVIWGLIGFSFAIPLCIFLLAINIEYLQTNLLKYKISIVILLLFIYHSHILPLFFVTLALFFQNILFHKTNIKKIISTSIPYLAGILLIFYFYYYFLNVETQRLGTQITTDSFVKSKLQESAFNNLILQKLYYFYFENFSYFSFKFGRLIGFIFSIILLLPLIIGTLLNKNSKIPQKIKIKQNLILYTIFYFLLIYFIYPGFNTDWQRFSVFSFLLIIVLTSSFFLKINKKIIPFTIITCLVYFFLITDFFIDYNVENKDFNKTLFEGVPKNKILSGLTLDDKFRGQHKLIHHLPDYHITWNKGIETLKLGSGYPHYQIRRKVNREILPYPQWTIGREKVYYGAFNNSDYLILRGTLEEFYDSESKKMILDNFYEIRKQGKWILFKNKKGD